MLARTQAALFEFHRALTFLLERRRGQGIDSRERGFPLSTLRVLPRVRWESSKIRVTQLLVVGRVHGLQATSEGNQALFRWFSCVQVANKQSHHRGFCRVGADKRFISSVDLPLRRGTRALRFASRRSTLLLLCVQNVVGVTVKTTCRIARLSRRYRFA